MKRPAKRKRHFIMSTALAVAFLSAGAFAQQADVAPSQSTANVTVVSKSVAIGFAS